MINFFRKIRKKMADDNPPDGRAGKPMKYMRYAIGEIVLVVVGILIALSINNWNEENKNKKTEHTLYYEIFNDLEKDEIKLEGLRVFYKNRIEHAGWLLRKVRNPDVSLDNIEVGKHIDPLYIGPLHVGYTSSFDAAKSSGAFANFKNKTILKALNQYYADFEELKGIMESTLRLLEFSLEPIMSKIPMNYINEESGTYVLTSEAHDNKAFYQYIASIKDKRSLSVNINSVLQTPEFESYLMGDLGRSFNALESLEIRIAQLIKIKNEIEQYISI